MSDESETEAALAFDYGEGDRSAIDIIGNYLPEKEDYAAKTVLEQGHPMLLARLEFATSHYDELDEFEEPVGDWVDAYEKRRTSVGGMSRAEFSSILQSLSGGGGASTEDSAGMLERMLKKQDGDD